MTKPAVIVVSDFAWVNGGASRVAITEALALSQRNYEVLFFAAVGPVDEDLRRSPVKTVLLGQPELAHHPKPVVGAMTGLWNRGAAQSLANVLRGYSNRSAVIHLHIWVKALSPSVYSVIRRSGIPTVVTAHDYFLACPNGGFYNYRSNRICQLRALSPSCIVSNCDKRNYGQKLWRVARHTVQRTVRLPVSLHHVIAVSDLSANILRQYLSPQTTIHRLDNPIGTVKREPVSMNEASAYLFAGRLEPEKGPDLFAEAAARLGIVPTFAGEGALREPIRLLAPNARMAGWLTPHELAREMAGARVLVFPSRLYETMGLSVLEAASLGVAAIVPDSCAASEQVIHGKTGLVYRASDRNALGDTLSAFQDLSAARRMGRAAWEKFWSAPPTVDRHVDELEALYGLMMTRTPS